MRSRFRSCVATSSAVDPSPRTFDARAGNRLELLLNLGRGYASAEQVELAWIVRKKPIWSTS